ncbi:MAG: aldo/keto reductase, partial [Oscillospiraceae bacterium]|nr:aldo/keto reductase [Oscillospiraceae bacterium]
SYKNRYWKRSFFDAVEPIRGLCAQFEIPVAEASFRWLAHHSALSAAGGDGVIVGASNIGQLSKNIASLRGDALPDALVDAFDQAQLICKADAPPYFRFTD